MNKKNLMLMNLKKNARILDLGCGKKNSNTFLNKFVWRGVDNRFKRKNIIQQDINSYLKKTSQKFDLILTEYSLQCMDKPVLTARYIKQALSKSGYWYLAGFNMKEKIARPFTKKDFLQFTKGMKILYWKEKQVFDNHRPYGKHIHFVTYVLVQKQDI